MRLEDLVKVLDSNTRIELTNANGNLMFNDSVGKLNIEYYSFKILSIVPQDTSRECYLEVITY
jgi:hypothetical protein